MSLKSGRITIKEVAAVAGVSTQTVSRVINKRPDVAPETRERVKKVIEELDYRPSALARSLIQQRSYTLGVVTAGLKHIGPSRTLNGITQIAEDAGYAVLLKELPHYHTNEIEPILQELLARHVDGILWAVPEIGNNHDWVETLTFPLDPPLVFLNMKPHDRLTVVSLDNYQGGYQAMTHLFEQGYHRIGHISGPLDWWEAKQRKAAWQDSLREKGLDIKDSHWVEGDWSSASGAEAAEKLLDQYPNMDAIFVANDQMALGVLRIAHMRGINIPEDMGIIGYDNIPETAYFYPPLTTIYQDYFSVAKVAVESMIQSIESGWQGKKLLDCESILIAPELVVRESSLVN